MQLIDFFPQILTLFSSQIYPYTHRHCLDFASATVKFELGYQNSSFNSDALNDYLVCVSFTVRVASS